MSVSTVGKPDTRTVTLDTNLENKTYYAVKFDSTDDDVVNLAEDGAAPSFVLGDSGNGSTTELVGSIVVGGETYAKLGGTVSAGAYLMPTSGGAWVTATDGNYYGCQALRGGVSGDQIPVKVIGGYLETT